MDFCRSAFSSAEVFDARKVEDGEIGLESARIWELRNWSLRSMIVGAEEAILITIKGLVVVEIVLRRWLMFLWGRRESSRETRL